MREDVGFEASAGAHHTSPKSLSFTTACNVLITRRWSINLQLNTTEDPMCFTNTGLTPYNLLMNMNMKEGAAAGASLTSLGVAHLWSSPKGLRG